MSAKTDDARKLKKGYVQVYTGNGKGKTTAALGLVLRTLGHGEQVAVVQFITGFVFINVLVHYATNAGMGGDDTLVGGAGNDILDGGDGTADRAVFSGPLAEYALAYDEIGGIFILTDNRPGRDGVDTVSGVEQFSFSDGVRSAEEIRSLAGTTHAAPVLAATLANQAAASGSAFSFTVPASTFTDADTAKLSYTATQGNGTALPAWLSFNPTTCSFSGTPPAGNSSAFVAKVTASDGTSSASDTFVISTGNAIDDDWLFLATIGNAWFNQTFGQATMTALQAEVRNYAQGDPIKFAGLVYEIFFSEFKLADIAAGFANNLGLLSSTAFVNEVASRLNSASSGYERGVALYQVTQEFVAGTLCDAALSRSFGVELDYALVFATISGTVNTHTNPDGSPIELPAPTGEQRFSGLSARENEFDGGGSDTAPSIFEGEVFIDVVGIGGPTLLL